MKEIEKAILEKLLFFGPLSPIEMMKDIEVPKPSFFRILRSLADRGHIEKAIDDLTTCRRASYRVVIQNLPAEIIESYRAKLGVLIESLDEFKRGPDPKYSKAVTLFVEAGIFTFEEIKKLAEVYEKNWSELDFLKRDSYTMPPKFGPVIRESLRSAEGIRVIPREAVESLTVIPPEEDEGIRVRLSASANILYSTYKSNSIITAVQNKLKNGTYQF